jgi:hypothetical protein
MAEQTISLRAQIHPGTIERALIDVPALIFTIIESILLVKFRRTGVGRPVGRRQQFMSDS